MMIDYDYLQQHVTIEIPDINDPVLYGKTDIYLAPKRNNMKTLRLHSRHLHIEEVLINDQSVNDFEYLSFLNLIVEENYRDMKSFDLFYRGSIVASKEGELIINIPPGTDCFKPNTQNNLPREETSPSNVTWESFDVPNSKTAFEIIKITIRYMIKDPSGGLRWIQKVENETSKSDLYDEKNVEARLYNEKTWASTLSAAKSISSHVYTMCGPFGGLCDGARTWMPCRDTVKDMCTFRFEFIVPSDCVAVSGGSLVDQIVLPDAGKRIFRYIVSTPTSASSLGFAVGPFQMLTCTEDSRITSFCLPECYDFLSSSTKDIHKSMQFFESYLKKAYPFQFFQQVFVYDPLDIVCPLAGGAILDQNLLHSRNVIDREMTSTTSQAKAIIASWISAAIGLHTTKDAWVLIGLVLYLVNVYIRDVFGIEEYEHRLELAMDAITTLELISKTKPPALISAEVDVYAEYSTETLAFLEIKAPLVIHMIENLVGAKLLQKSIHTIISGIDYSNEASTENINVSKATTEDKMQEDEVDDSNVEKDSTLLGKVQSLSTLHFLRVVRSLAGASGQDLTKSFLGNWILESGMPFFTVGFWYNRKQTQAELVLQQDVPIGGELYNGLITITIVEDTGEYTYQKRIENKRHKWDFPCHSKVRKKRRKRQGLEDPDDSISVNGPGMGLNDTPVYWIKIDSGYSWLRHIIVHQPDFNWMEQLFSDKQTGSRVQAVRFLSLFPRPHEKPNVMSCRVITECMSGLTTHLHRLRTEAALSLGIWQSIHAPLTNANTKLPIWKGLHNLVRIFKEHFFDLSTDMPLPNYFLPSGGKVLIEALGTDNAKTTDSSSAEVKVYATGEYEIKKAIPIALSLIHAQNGKSPPEIEEFLVQLLKQNDNSKNFIHMENERELVEDCFYIGTVIMACSRLCLEHSVIHKNENDTANLINQLLLFDQVQPSFQHVVSICALEALCNLKLSGRCVFEIPFHTYASWYYPLVVRKAAIESIIRLYFSENPNPNPNPNGNSSNVPSSHESPIGMESPVELHIEKPNYSDIYGPLAAFDWVTKLVTIETSPSIRHFCIRALLDNCNGLPPRMATDTLSSYPYSHVLFIRRHILNIYPSYFFNESPNKDVVLKLFSRPSLSQLQQDDEIVVKIVERLWCFLNEYSSYDQRLRIMILSLYRTVWGDNTPPCMSTHVKEKNERWTGGYESLRKLIDETKRQRRVVKHKPSSSHQQMENNSQECVLNISPSKAIENLKGKKLKFKIGNDVIQ